MTTFVQMHLLTVYPTSNLNRDETGRPKTIEFGGVQRIRISSQSLKRAWRTSTVFQDGVSGNIGVRTQRIGAEMFEYLMQNGMAEKPALATARTIAGVFGKLDKEGQANPTFTKQLVFLSSAEISRARELADRALAGEKIRPKAGEILERAGAAVDIAMFGRMLTDEKKEKKDNADKSGDKDEDAGSIAVKRTMFNREAAVQVAHALTTHRGVVEDDFLVAVDDLNSDAARENTGTSFVDEQQISSGVFYTYVCVDTSLLVANLGGDQMLARDAVAALVETAAKVSPRGKQATFASRARGGFVLLERGAQQPRSLAAAFLREVGVAEANGDLLEASHTRLARLLTNMDTAYGACADARVQMYCSAERVDGSLAELVTFARECIA